MDTIPTFAKGDAVADRGDDRGSDDRSDAGIAASVWREIAKALTEIR